MNSLEKLLNNINIKYRETAKPVKSVVLKASVFRDIFEYDISPSGPGFQANSVVLNAPCGAVDVFIESERFPGVLISVKDAVEEPAKIKAYEDQKGDFAGFGSIKKGAPL